MSASWQKDANKKLKMFCQLRKQKPELFFVIYYTDIMENDSMKQLSHIMTSSGFLLNSCS